MLVEISTDFLFPGLEIILVGEVFIAEVLFYGTACPRLLIVEAASLSSFKKLYFVFLCVW